MHQQTPPECRSVSIAAVERDCGIGKDALRIWERRYGFPAPGRDGYGERIYPLEQVEKLRLIKRLLDLGHRPGRIVALPMDTLQRLSYGQAGAAQLPGQANAAWAEMRDVLACVREHDAHRLRQRLRQAARRLGQDRFITELVAPLNEQIGNAWMRGELEIFEEHLYTQCLTSVLRHAIDSVAQAQQATGPAILLTTFPQESHGLGLLMAESLLSLAGCHCLSLGTQTPLPDIVKAAQARQVDVVALSFSQSLNPKQVYAGLQELRQLMPAPIELWAGGRNPALLRRPVAGVLVLDALDKIAPQVRDWRQHRQDGQDGQD